MRHRPFDPYLLASELARRAVTEPTHEWTIELETTEQAAQVYEEVERLCHSLVLVRLDRDVKAKDCR